jgi:hypothetical protein
MTLEEALELVKEQDKEVASIKHELYRLCWYMRGGLTADEAFAMGYDDRKIISDIIKDNLETTKKTGMNFF